MQSQTDLDHGGTEHMPFLLEAATEGQWGIGGWRLVCMQAGDRAFAEQGEGLLHQAGAKVLAAEVHVTSIPSVGGLQHGRGDVIVEQCRGTQALLQADTHPVRYLLEVTAIQHLADLRRL